MGICSICCCLAIICCCSAIIGIWDRITMDGYRCGTVISSTGFTHSTWDYITATGYGLGYCSPTATHGLWACENR